MNLRLSCDDGCRSDLRVADLASKYEIPCTFYLPVEWHSLAYENGYEPLDYYEASMLADHHEVGSHTITHRHLTRLRREDAEAEIIESKFMLQNLFDIPITKFCPPRGYTNPHLTAKTLQLYESQRLTKGQGLVHVHPNSGANNNIHWLERVKEVDLVELWMHSWELDKYPEEWDNLERFLRENLAR